MHDVVQRLHRFLDRSVAIESMNLIQIDRFDSEPLQTRIDCRKMRLRESPLMLGRSAGFGPGALPPLNARSTG
jgi:hypothetical protein